MRRFIKFSLYIYIYFFCIYNVIKYGHGRVALIEVHNHCDAIVDGANVGLCQHNFVDYGFNLPHVVKYIFWSYIASQAKRL